MGQRIDHDYGSVCIILEMKVRLLLVLVPIVLNSIAAPLITERLGQGSTQLFFSDATFERQHSGTSQRQCLEYEPKVVALTGVVKRAVFPGPPNYESVARGDAVEKIWVLHLKRKICVLADSTNEINKREEGLRDLQLIVGDANDYGKYKLLLGRRVTVTGQLTHAITGHHHTAVLLAIEGMKFTPKTSQK